MNYSYLPRRYVISHNKKKPYISYGAIVYALDTKKWCLVQRRHSPEFIELIRGHYNHADISVLKYGLSRDEHVILLELLGDTSPDKYEVIYQRTVPGEDWEFGYTKFIDCYNRLNNSLRDFDGVYEDTEWLWPKGRPLKNEQQRTTAVREFFEETGIEDMELQLVSQIPLIESYRGANGLTYQTKCWVYTTKHEIKIKPYLLPNMPTEIKNGGWFEYETAYRLLRDTKKSTLVQAERLTKKYN